MITIVEDVATLPFCVYAHYVDDELVYIGSGELGRAVNINTRKPDHKRHLTEGKSKVLILERFSDLTEARDREKVMIESCRPVFNYMHARKQTLTERANKRDIRPVRCLRTGECFYSTAHLSSVRHHRINHIHEHLRGLAATVEGYTYERVDWHESGLRREDRWLHDQNVTYGDVLSYATSRAVLDVILDSIVAGDKAPTNAEISALSNCTPANVDGIIKRLVKAGYITIEKVSANERVFGATDKMYIPVKTRAHTERRKRISNASRVYSILKRCASDAKPCPSNADLAEALDISIGSVQKSLRSLKDKGLISVTMVGDSGRYITVDGHRTSETTNVNIAGITTIERQTRVRDYITL